MADRRDDVMLVDDSKFPSASKRPNLWSFRELIKTDKYEDVIRIYFCYQIGSTYLALGLLESSIIGAMLACDKIHVAKGIGEDIAKWELLLKKHKTLHESTLGSLIRIVENSTLNKEKIAYLHFLKTKRDYFIHRMYHIGPWPGDCTDQEVVALCRRVLYLEHIFRRAVGRVFPLFANLGLLEIVPLGEDGALLMNVGDEAADQAPLRELLIEATRRRAAQHRKTKKSRE